MQHAGNVQSLGFSCRAICKLRYISCECHYSKHSACASNLPCWSLPDSAGVMPCSGHLIPMAGSFQAMQRSYWGAQKSVVLYRNSAVSLRTKKPCAKPGGTQICLLFCAESISPTHFPNVGDDLRMSTTTSKTSPCVTCTNLPCGSWI